MTSKSFSQIVISESTAKLVVKDLVTYDGLSIEYKLLQERIDVFESKVLTLQGIIDNNKNQITNKDSIILQKDSQIDNYKMMTDDLQKALKREIRAKKMYKIGATIAVAFALYNSK